MITQVRMWTRSPGGAFWWPQSPRVEFFFLVSLSTPEANREASGGLSPSADLPWAVSILEDSLSRDPHGVTLFKGWEKQLLGK